MNSRMRPASRCSSMRRWSSVRGTLIEMYSTRSSWRWMVRTMKKLLPARERNGAETWPGSSWMAWAARPPSRFVEGTRVPEDSTVIRPANSPVMRSKLLPSGRRRDSSSSTRARARSSMATWTACLRSGSSINMRSYSERERP